MFSNFAKTFFFISLIFACVCGFILYATPSSHEKVLFIVRIISQFGKNFKANFYTGVIRFLEHLTSFGLIQIKYNPDYLISIDWSNSFSFSILLGTFATGVVGPLYLVLLVINFWFTTFRTIFECLYVIFLVLIPIESLDNMFIFLGGGNLCGL